MGRTRRLSQTVAAMTVVTFAGQMLALLRESAVAAKFGANAPLDAYLLAILVPNAILLLVQSGLTMAFIPLVASQAAGRDGDSDRETSNLINCVLVILAGVVVLAIVCADAVVGVLAPSLPPDTRALTVRMYRPLMLTTMLGGASALLTAVLNVHRNYIIPSLFSVILNAATILCLVLLADRLSIYALVVATIGGFGLQAVLLIYLLPSVHKHQWILRFTDPLLTRLFVLSGPAVLTLGLQQGIVFVDRAMAVQLGVGSVALLNYASRLTLFVLPLLMGAISAIILPEISLETAKGNDVGARDLGTTTLRYTLVVAAPVGALLFILRTPLLRLAFEHGSFTPADTVLTAGPMGFYTITLVAVCLREVVIRLFYAGQDTLTPLWSGAVRALVNVVLNVLLARSIGIAGIALANATAIVIDVLMMTWVLRERWNVPIGWRFPTKVAVATVCCGAAAYWTYDIVARAIDASAWVALGGELLCAGVVGVLGYCAASYAAGLTETWSLVAKGLASVTSWTPGQSATLTSRDVQ
jgi:putative peptidoglycan lipid II flippase